MDYQVYPDINFGEFPEYAYDAGLGATIGTALGAMAGVFVAVYSVLILLSVAMYIMNGIALFRMAKRTGVRHGWLGFIPIGEIYLSGRIADAGTGKRTRTKMLMASLIAFAVLYLLFIVVLAGAVASAPMSDTFPATFIVPMLIIAVLLFVAAICLCVFQYVAYYYICDNFGGSNGVVYFIGILLATFFMPIIFSVLLLVLSGKTAARTDAPVVTCAIEAEKTDNVF